MAYMWNLKNNTNQCIYKTDSQTTKNKFVVNKGEKEVGRDKIGVWDYQIQTIMYKIHKQQRYIV